jgi:hypothetical protein
LQCNNGPLPYNNGSLLHAFGLQISNNAFFLKITPVSIYKCLDQEDVLTLNAIAISGISKNQESFWPFMQPSSLNEPLRIVISSFLSMFIELPLILPLYKACKCSYFSASTSTNTGNTRHFRDVQPV